MSIKPIQTPCDQCTQLGKVVVQQTLEIQALKEALESAKAQAAALQEALRAIESQTLSNSSSKPAATSAAAAAAAAPASSSVVATPAPAPAAAAAPPKKKEDTRGDAEFARRLQASMNYTLWHQSQAHAYYGFSAKR